MFLKKWYSLQNDYDRIRFCLWKYKKDSCAYLAAHKSVFLHNPFIHISHILGLNTKSQICTELLPYLVNSSIFRPKILSYKIKTTKYLINFAERCAISDTNCILTLCFWKRLSKQHGMWHYKLFKSHSPLEQRAFVEKLNLSDCNRKRSGIQNVCTS